MYNEVWHEDWFTGEVYLWKHHAEFGRRGLEKQLQRRIQNHRNWR
jgi:hypothetical protein